jgi:hypothetical protein
MLPSDMIFIIVLVVNGKVRVGIFLARVLSLTKGEVNFKLASKEQTTIDEG